MRFSPYLLAIALMPWMRPIISREDEKVLVDAKDATNGKRKQRKVYGCNGARECARRVRQMRRDAANRAMRALKSAGRS